MLSTTAAVLEILIIGIQGVLWLGFALSAILGEDALTRPPNVPDAFSVAALGLIAYALGVIIDRMADSLDAFWRTDVGRDLPPVPTMRLRMMQVDDGRSRFLEYQRSRLRIARGTVLNLAVLIATSLWFMIARAEMRWWQITGIEVILVALLVAAFLSALGIGDAYDKRLVDAYSMWARDHQDQAEGDGKARGRARQEWRRKREERLAARGAPRRCDRAAAVCYRMSERGLEFFLVETADGHRWTFPKGKLEDDESFEEAAVREAEEEAGVIGSIEGELTTFRYPGKASKGCPSVQVRAFLLLVDAIGDQAPGDRHRKRRWCTPEEARKKLAKRRDEEYANEHARVVAEAMSTIA